MRFPRSGGAIMWNVAQSELRIVEVDTMFVVVCFLVVVLLQAGILIHVESRLSSSGERKHEYYYQALKDSWDEDLISSTFGSLRYNHWNTSDVENCFAQLLQFSKAVMACEEVVGKRWGRWREYEETLGEVHFAILSDALSRPLNMVLELKRYPVFFDEAIERIHDVGRRLGKQPRDFSKLELACLKRYVLIHFCPSRFNTDDRQAFRWALQSAFVEVEEYIDSLSSEVDFSGDWCGTGRAADNTYARILWEEHGIKWRGYRRTYDRLDDVLGI